MNKTHKHATLMLQFAQDAAETETPWERWEHKNGNGIWAGMSNIPCWISDFEYRRKPRTININGFEVTEPLREKPENGTEYYVVELHTEPHVACITWDDEDFDNYLLSMGICHLTAKAAKLHAKALLSFTKK